MINPKRADFMEAVQPTSFLGHIFVGFAIITSLLEHFTYKIFRRGTGVPCSLVTFHRYKLSAAELDELSREEREDLENKRGDNEDSFVAGAEFTLMMHPSFARLLAKNRELRQGYAEVLISNLQELNRLEEAQLFREQVKSS